jgi:hypothetical protein
MKTLAVQVAATGLFTPTCPVSLAMSSAFLLGLIGGLDPAHQKACFFSLSPDLSRWQASAAVDVIAFVAIPVFNRGGTPFVSGNAVACPPPIH